MNTMPTDQDTPWASLPSIPGGWTLQTIDVEGHSLELVLPAIPDEFLDDPDVLEANRRDDYMPYWSYLWPAATTMAAAVRRAEWAAETEILEVGCGIGLVGLSALTRGWRVTFSDYDPLAVQCALLNAARNGLSERASGLVLDWRQPVDRQWPVILGCEVTYEPRLHEILLNLVDSIMTQEGLCWLGDPGRSQALPFYEKARAHGFALRRLNASLEETHDRPGESFQMTELRRSS